MGAIEYLITKDDRILILDGHNLLFVTKDKREVMDWVFDHMFINNHQAAEERKQIEKLERSAASKEAQGSAFESLRDRMLADEFFQGVS